MANKQMASLAKKQADKLLFEVRSGIKDIRDVNLNIDVLLENAGIGMGILGDDVSSAEMLDELKSKNKFIRSIISLIKQLKKNKADLDALTKPEIKAIAQTGRGPSLAYAINTQLGINRRRLRAGDIMTAAEQRAQEFVGPIASQEQIDDGLRAEKERRRNHYNYLRKQAAERRAERKERKENHYNYLRKQAKERGELYSKAPWIKSLIKSGMINQKYIPGISKTLTRISRTPILGGVASLAIKHPVASAAMLSAWMARERVLSDIKMTGLSQGPKAFGAVPENFRKAMMATGLSEEQLQKEYYSLVGRYGPGAMQYLTSISKSMASMTPDQRNIVAQGLGMSANLVNAGMYLSGARTPDRAARVTMYNKMLETVSSYGLSEYGSKTDWLKSQFLRWEIIRNAKALGLSDTDEKPYDFRDYKSVFSIREKNLKEATELEAKYNEIMAIIGESQGAADSAVRYDSQGSASSVTNNNNTGGTVTINQVIYASGNAQEIADKVGDETQEAVNRQRVIDAITTGDKQ